MTSDIAEVPRKGVRSMVVAYAGAASLLALPAPTAAILVAARIVPDAWVPFADGAPFAWLTPSVLSLTAAALGVLGGFFLAGKKVPGWVLHATALAPFIAGVTVAALKHQTLMLSVGRALTRVEGPQLLAAGSGEAESTVVLGATMSALAMLLVALASLFRVLTLDASVIDPQGTRRPALPMAVTAGAMVVAIVIAIAARAHLQSEGYRLSLVVLVSSLGVGVLAAWRAPLAAIVDREDADTFRTLVLLALASASSVLLGGVAAYVIARRGALDVLSALDVLPDHAIGASFHAEERFRAEAPAKARLLAEALSKMHAARLLGWIEAGVLLLGLSVPAMMSGAWRTGLRPRASLVAWAAIILLVASAVGVQSRLVKKASSSFHQRDPAEAVADLVVPTTRESWAQAEDVPSARAHGHLPLVYVTRDGKLLFDLEPTGTSAPTPATNASLALFLETVEERTRSLNARVEDWDYLSRLELGLVADRDVTYRTLKTALAPVLTKFTRFSLVLAPAPEKRVDRSAFGDLASFVAHDGMEAELLFYDTTDPEDEPFTTIVVEGASAKLVARVEEYSFDPVVVPMGDQGEGARRKAYQDLGKNGPVGCNACRAASTSLGIAPRDDDTLATVLKLSDEVRSLRESDFTIVLSSDWRALQERAGEPRKPTTGANVGISRASVKGRLPPEVVTRIVRQNLGKLRLCYENGLRSNPMLMGSTHMTINFVIDPSGTVTTAAPEAEHTTANLHEVALRESIAPCIVHGFAILSFPQPEEGSVSVVVDIRFAGRLP